MDEGIELFVHCGPQETKEAMERRLKIRRKIDAAAAKEQNENANPGAKKEEKKRVRVSQSGAAVDPYCTVADARVETYSHFGNDSPYTATLTKTDLTTGKNSFYALQLLSDGAQYYVFRRWGRVGDDMASDYTTKTFSSLSSAVREFTRTYSSKTGIEWGDRESKKGERVPGKFFPLETSYTGKQTQVDEDGGGGNGDSDLDTATIKLMNMLFDKKMMVETMKEMEIDVSKMPLGNLSQSTLQEGKSKLKQLSKIVKASRSEAKQQRSKEKEGSEAAFSPANQNKIRSLSNQFYMSIPHVIPKKAAPASFLLDTSDKIGNKIELIDELSDILMAQTILNKRTRGESAVLTQYRSLKTPMTLLSKKSDEFQMIDDYFQNSHSSRHTSFVVEEVWKIAREGEEQRYAPWAKNNNRKLLFHGSRLSNWVRILAQGLRIAPPEAPATGYMFGKGVYFADMSSKSAGYCHLGGGSGLMAVAEVALGKTDVRYASDSSLPRTLKSNCDSVYARGDLMPDVAGDMTLPSGAVLPKGYAMKANLNSRSSLYHNEFIVYDVSQIVMRYLLKIRDA